MAATKQNRKTRQTAESKTSKKQSAIHKNGKARETLVTPATKTLATSTVAPTKPAIRLPI